MVDPSHQITQPYLRGSLVFTEPMWTNGTEAPPVEWRWFPIWNDASGYPLRPCSGDQAMAGGISIELT